MGRQTYKVELRKGGTRRYLGGAFVQPTSYPGNSTLGLGVFDEDGDFDPVVELVTASGERITIAGHYLNLLKKK